MRELLLRLEAERVGAPGKSGPPTQYFREQARRLLRRNPRLGARYRRAARRARRERMHLVPGHAVREDAPGGGVPLRREEIAPVLTDEPGTEEGRTFRTVR